MKTVSSLAKWSYDTAERTTTADVVGIPKNVIAVDTYTYVNDNDAEVELYRIVFDDNTYITTGANGIVEPIAKYLASTPESDRYPFRITIGTRTSKNGRSYYYLQ